MLPESLVSQIKCILQEIIKYLSERDVPLNTAKKIINLGGNPDHFDKFFRLFHIPE
jgi:hypothetical protein